MPPVRRHRIGEQMPAVIHPGPDPDALDSAGSRSVCLVSPTRMCTGFSHIYRSANTGLISGCPG